jgi:hypothetical protein
MCSSAAEAAAAAAAAAAEPVASILLREDTIGVPCMGETAPGDVSMAIGSTCEHEKAIIRQVNEEEESTRESRRRKQRLQCFDLCRLLLLALGLGPVEDVIL